MSIKMTNKRAICILKWLLDSVDENGRIDVGSWYHDIDKDFKESLSEAIKALEILDKCTYFKQDACGKCTYYDWQTGMRKDYCETDTKEDNERPLGER